MKKGRTRAKNRSHVAPATSPEYNRSVRRNTNTFARHAGFAVLLLAASMVAAQDAPETEIVHPNQRVTVPDLAFVTATDTGSTAIAQAALAIVLSVSKTKCDRGSQINIAVDGTAGTSLRTLAFRLSGASCSVNGSTIRLKAGFTPNEEIRPESLIVPVMQGQPLLFEWKGALYVLYEVVYDEHIFSSGQRDNLIRELLLIDPRYSDQRRFVAFERDKDDFAQVEGIASASVGQ